MLIQGACRLLIATSRRVTPRRFAGHSKWANIKDTKMKMDMKRQRFINWMAVRMRGAIQAGGTDPDINIQLRHIMEEASLNDIPKSTINGMLERLKTAKMNVKDVMMELRGPGGSCFLLSLCCHNLQLERSTVRNIARKHRVAVENAMHAFEKAAYVVTEVPEGLQCGGGGEGDSELVVPDRVMDDAIVSGAEEVRAEQWDDKVVLVFSSGWDEVMAVRKALTELKYTIRSTDKVYEPRDLIELSDDDMKLMVNMCDKFRNMESFSTLITNVAELEESSGSS